MERLPHAELARAEAAQATEVTKEANATEVIELALAAAAYDVADLSENYRRLVARAVDVFGDEIKASRWLSLPNSDLNGATPLQAAESEGYSAHLLEPFFNRIEHGIDY